MSGYILCQVQKAKEPYYIESISMNIYSIEELCYYFQKNLYLIDETILNEDLYQWIRESLGLEILYRKICNNTQKKNPQIRDVVYPVFKEINYLSYEEMKSYESQVAAFEKKSLPVRMKMKGDRLVENGMYVNARKVYMAILREYSLSEELTKSFLGSVYHNIGCVHSYLFQKEEALEYFKKAYEILPTGNSLKTYLYAFYNARTREEYKKLLEELGVDQATSREVLAAIKEVEETRPPKVEESRIDATLDQMIRDYHRSTGA